jgi:hypothetical protein
LHLAAAEIPPQCRRIRLKTELSNGGCSSLARLQSAPSPGTSVGTFLFFSSVHPMLAQRTLITTNGEGRSRDLETFWRRHLGVRQLTISRPSGVNEKTGGTTADHLSGGSGCWHEVSTRPTTGKDVTQNVLAVRRLGRAGTRRPRLARVRLYDGYSSDAHIATRLTPGDPSPSDQSIKGWDLRSSAAFSARR